MDLLYDINIRSYLIDKLNRQSIRPKAIVEELRIHNGNAIADVVALYKDAHCFEIKSDFDKVERVVKQGEYFDLSFRKITLVTTKKHLQKAIKISPSYWGILLAQPNEQGVSFRSIRRCTSNPNFDKKLALMTLWKRELLSLVDQNYQKDKSKSREWLASLISNCRKKGDVSNNISSLLISRFDEPVY